MTNMKIAIQVGTLREVVLAQLAYERALNEFSKATGIKALKDAQADALQEFCGAADPREVTEDTLNDLLTQMESAK
jgi:hypothetical protein